MTDDIKDLLTLAAKACGYEVDWCEETGRPAIRDQHGGADYLAPHLDDGDGARMEAKLHIDVTWNKGEGLVFANLYEIHPVHEYFTDHNNDRQAARRWASLRAAAQIGGQMP